MTNEEAQVQIALGTYLQTMWELFLRFKECGDVLWQKGQMIKDPDHRLQVMNNGSILWIKGTRLWYNAVEKCYGKDVEIEWPTLCKAPYQCKLSNGIEFRQ